MKITFEELRCDFPNLSLIRIVFLDSYHTFQMSDICQRLKCLIISLQLCRACGSSLEDSVTRGAEIVCFCCFGYAVNDYAGFRTGNRVDHDPVLFPDAESTD